MTEQSHFSDEDSEFRYRSIVVSVGVPTFLFAVGMGAVVPLLPLYALDLGMTVAMAGALVGIRSLATAIADVPSGFLVSRFGEKRSMVLATTMMAGAAVMIGVSTSAVALIAAVALMGAVGSVLQLSRVSYAADVAPVVVRGRVMSTLGGAQRLGVLIGPLLGGIVISLHGIVAAFYLQAFFCAAATACLVILTPDTHEQQRPTLVASDPRVRSHRRPYWSLIARIAIVSLLIQVVRASRDALIPLWGSDIGLTASEVSLVFGSAAALEVLLVPCAGMISDRFGRKWSAIPCLSIISIGIALTPLATSLGTLLLVGVVIGVGNGLGSGIQMTLGSDLSPPGRRATFLGVWRLTIDGGSTLGPFIIAVTTSAVGLSSGAYLVGGVGLIGAAFAAAAIPDTSAVQRRLTD